MRKAGVILLGALAGASPAVAAHAAQPFRCPHVGGDFAFGQEADADTLDQMASPTISTRNIAMNVYEALMTRDENNDPILDLARSMQESPDHLTYTFRLRQGVHFHNGKPLTSADVVASFDRYAKVGSQRSTLDNVDRWDAPAADTFVIHMKRFQPTFIEALSSFSVPIVIIPSEERDIPARQLAHPVGTGPFELVESVPGRYVKLKRFEGYTPNASFTERTGLGGYKQACLDTVTFRIVTVPAARVGGLRSGELQGVEDVPAASVAELGKDPHVVLLPMKNWWIQLAYPNASNPPTDNLMFRKAVQAVLDMNRIMDAAGGSHTLSPGFQYPGQPDYADAGGNAYNLHDPALARKYLAQAGYEGEPVVLLTNKDYPSMYNAALVVRQELQSIGINAQMKVLGWPAAVQTALDSAQGWNFMFTGWGTQPALGALATMQFLVQPNAVYRPRDGKDDPDVLAAWNGMNDEPTVGGRRKAFATMQRLVLDRAYAIPFGARGIVQAVRSNVNGFVPFRIPRLANVWLSN